MTAERPRRTIRPKCDQCQILVINNVVCHETGCPNSWKGTARKCRSCGDDFKVKSARQQRCRDCEL